MKNFRLLKKNEIKVRVLNQTANGVVLSLYTDARVVQNVLDETVGSANWECSYNSVNDDLLFCTLSVWDENKAEWISKQDVGTESFTEKEKGRVSDAFKRAAVAFGIARELYSAPFLFIKNSDIVIENGKCKSNFVVRKIQYDTNEDIGALVIQDTKTGKTIFTWQSDNFIKECKDPNLQEKLTEINEDFKLTI